MIFHWTLLPLIITKLSHARCGPQKFRKVRMARVPIVGVHSRPGAEVDSSDHFCPGCGVRQKFVPRYPWYLCSACLDLAEDHAGRRLVFQNTTLSGGFGWRYADDIAASATECTAVVCLIRKREILVREARFGGVVAEPFSAAIPEGRGRLGIVRLSVP